MSSSLQRLLFIVLAIGCMLLTGWSGMRASDLLVAARSSELAEAERAILSGTVSLIEQDRIPDRLVLSVQALMTDPALDLEFLTVRNAQQITLVSRGRLENGGSWLSSVKSRAIRGWFYRTAAAESNRPIARDGQTVGFAHFGVAWTSIGYAAGLPLFIWASALVAGLIGLFGAALRASAAQETHSDVSPAKTATTRGRRRRVSRPRFGRGSFARDNEFAPIADLQSPKPAQKGRSPSATTASARPAASTNTPARAPTPKKAPSIPPLAFPAAPTYVAPKKKQEKAEPVKSPSPAKELPATPAVAKTLPAMPLEAPRIDARPKLGDSTLDLRFYPIWRGTSATERVLAGACAALAWRAGEAELVDSDTLTRLAEKDGALRAFTQWIARRFSLLHGNWRTLELHTVPIVLPIPSAMLAFADAEAVWRDALRRTDRDPNDLILRLDSKEAAKEQASLPLRRALTVNSASAELPSDCDLLCMSPAAINGNASAWRARFDTLDRPVLFGPVEDPDKYADIVNHERVLWFSDGDADVHSPRSFARLLARQTPRPI